MDFMQLGSQAAQSDNIARPVVSGRVLQADADFFCYYCARLDESVSSNFKHLKDLIDNKRDLVGASLVNVHLTLGLKGGRNEMATVKEYQGKRDDNRDPDLKKRVHELRSLLTTYKTNNVQPVVNVLQEADDSLTQYQWKAINSGDRDKSIILSGDKDLWMVEGLHTDDDGRVTDFKGYGKCQYKDVGNKTPKLVGQGTSWFWHQIIMGDQADNIAGLPMLSGRLANIYLPTKKHNPNRAALACGEAKAVAMLKEVSNDKQALRVVFEAYVDHYGTRAKEMLYEQAFLLWMRRTGNVNDVLTFLNSLGFNYKLTEKQLGLLKLFKERATLQIKLIKENL